MPAIGTEGQARIQNSYFAVSSTADELHARTLRLYAERAGLQESRQKPPSLPDTTLCALEQEIAAFCQDPACRSIALAAAESLRFLNDALAATPLSSVTSSLESNQ